MGIAVKLHGQVIKLKKVKSVSGVIHQKVIKVGSDKNKRSRPALLATHGPQLLLWDCRISSLDHVPYSSALMELWCN